MLKKSMRITLSKIITNSSQNKCQTQYSNFTKEDQIKFKIPIHRVIHNKVSKEIIINTESIEASHLVKESHKALNKFSPKFNKTVDILTLKIMKVQKEIMKEYNKKCQKLTTKGFTHKISNLMTFIITTFCTKTQELVEATMCNRYKTFINVKITPNKLTRKRWKKSRKVFTIKIKL